jgi:hypothetical protein
MPLKAITTEVTAAQPQKLLTLKVTAEDTATQNKHNRSYFRSK